MSDLRKWEHISCGCCNGLQWGGFYPRECHYCDGAGMLWRHRKSGALAMYPGGPFLGRDPSKRKRALPRAATEGNDNA